MDDGFPPLVHCDLGCGVVLVCPCIEFFDLSVLQFALEYAIIRVVCWKGRKTHYLGVIVIRGPESSDRLSIIRQCVVFICAQIKLLLLWTGACLPLGSTTISLRCERRCTSSTSLSLPWEFHGGNNITCFPDEASHRSCKSLCSSRKQFERLVRVNSKFGECMPCCKFE